MTQMYKIFLLAFIADDCSNMGIARSKQKKPVDIDC